MENATLAIVIPCYNEEEILNITKEKLSEVLDNLVRDDKISDKSYLLFVDDGSNDKTWEIIKSFNSENQTKYKGLKLSRDFGQQFALYSGLIENDADIVISIDADLQDDINTIYSMVEKYHEGYDIVYGVRNDRSTDSFFKKITADIFYKLTEIMGLKTIPQHADFRLISKRVAQELKNTTESNLYLRGIIPSLGFKSTKLYYKREKRIGGEAKYTFIKLILLAIDGITSFSTVPIRFISVLGLISFFIAVLMSFYALHSFVTKQIISGWTSLFISLYFIGGMTLLSLGIIGEYIGKIYQETKHRQRYIIEERLD